MKKETLEKVIEIMENTFDSVSYDCNLDLSIYYDSIRKQCAEQITEPVKPKYSRQGEYEKYYNCACGGTIFDWFEYCPCCGSEIDWSYE